MGEHFPEGHAREQCSKKKCSNAAALVIKIYTSDGGPKFVGFCMDHLLVASEVIDHMVSEMTGTIEDSDA